MNNTINMKPSPSIYILRDEYIRLLPLASAIPVQSTTEGAPSLLSELKRAIIVMRESRPDGLISMDCRVRCHDCTSGTLEDVILVWPNRADSTKNWISVLSPIGSALIGFSVGDTVEWPTPGGIRKLKIIEVEPDALPEENRSDTESLIRALIGR